MTRGKIPSDLGWLVDDLDELFRRIRTLETPSGEARTATVAKLTALVTSLQAQVDEYLATRYTNDQLYTKSEVDNLIASQIAAAFAGNVTVTGSLTVNGALAAASVSTAGSVSAGGISGDTINISGAVVMPGVYSYDVTSGGGLRRTVWAREDGRIGHT